MRDLASIRAAMAALDSASYDEIATRLSRFNVDDNPFRFNAIELMAVSAISDARYQDAWTLIATAMNFRDTMPQQLGERLNRLFAFMISREDFVPPTTGTPDPTAPPGEPTFEPRATPDATAEPAPTTPLPNLNLRAPTGPTTPALPGALIPGAGLGVPAPTTTPTPPTATPAPTPAPAALPVAPAVTAPIPGGMVPGVGAGFGATPAPAATPAAEPTPAPAAEVAPAPAPTP